MRSILKNARIIGPDQDFTGYLVIENGLITDIQQGNIAADGEDLHGRWLIPGCIDIHSDYWEKEIHPRPSADFPLDMAFHFMDQRAAACGLTTVFSAISFSEDDSKGRTFALGIERSKALERFSRQALVRHFVHARLNPNTDAVLGALPEIDRLEALKLVVFNDETPGQRQFRLEDQIERHARQFDISLEEARQIILAKIERVSKINHRGAIQEFMRHRQVLGSHDDTKVEHVEEAFANGCTLSEMPTTIEAARRARELGMWICMGAPNLVRGGSHCGNLSSLDALEEGLVDMFCSDYHFPTLLTGVLKLVDMGFSPSQAINLVSLHPARLLGMDQELGSIDLGKKADLVCFQPESSFARVESVWIEGEKRFHCHAAAVS